MNVREIWTEIDFLPEAIVLFFCLFVSVQVYGKNKKLVNNIP